jgi:hypothetical protein
MATLFEPNRLAPPITTIFMVYSRRTFIIVSIRRDRRRRALSWDIRQKEREDLSPGAGLWELLPSPLSCRIKFSGPACDGGRSFV